MKEKLRESVNKSGGAFGTLLSDLLKSLNCLAYEFLFAKLQEYGFYAFDKISLNLFYYPKESKQKS